MHPGYLANRPDPGLVDDDHLPASHLIAACVAGAVLWAAAIWAVVSLFS